jgi:hypothetical protein
MSYDPSQGMPPRQERWPHATPAEAWPSHRDGEGERAGRPGTRAQRAAGSHRRPSDSRSAVATAAFPAAGNAYGTADGFDPDSYRTSGYTSGGYAGATDDFAGAEDGYGWPGYGYPEAGNGYGEPQNGYDRTGNDYGRATGGYADTADGFASAPDGYPERAYLGPGSYSETAYPGPGYSGSGYYGPGYSEPGYPGTGYSEPGYPGAGYSGPGYSETGYAEPGYSAPGYPGAGYSEAGYSDPGYFGSEHSDSMLTAPDAGVHPGGWQQEQALRRAANHRGLMVSAATEFLATAVVIGVSTLAAGLLRTPVSPVGAMGTVFIDRTPAMLRAFAAHHFGTHGQAVLLFGMYVVIAVVAITIGVAARRAAALGVTGVAAFALILAFVAVTRPTSQVADVMPAVIGGLAGVAALLWLVRASAPIQGLEEVAPLRLARGGTRRRTR